jgi:hypothetical protein
MEPKNHLETNHDDIKPNSQKKSKKGFKDANCGTGIG